jgi:DtxR family Mn-dependent transcriptional regulator
MIKKQTGRMEDYLERIVMLSGENGIARVTQLSKSLEVRKPSVTAALNRLSKDGLVIHEKYGYVELTEEGKKIALDVLHRHKVIEQFLVEILGVNRETAWKDACEMEHSISSVSVEKLTNFIEHVLATLPETTK